MSTTQACRSADALDLRRLTSAKPLQLKFVLVNPVFEAPTREMRAALPEQVPFKQLISNSVAGASLVRCRSVAMSSAATSALWASRDVAGRGFCDRKWLCNLTSGFDCSKCLPGVLSRVLGTRSITEPGF